MCTFFNYTNIFSRNFCWAHFFPFFLSFFQLTRLLDRLNRKTAHIFFLQLTQKLLFFSNLLTFVSKWATTTILHLNLRFALVWLTAFFMWCIWKLDELFLLFFFSGFFFNYDTQFSFWFISFSQSLQQHTKQFLVIKTYFLFSFSIRPT